METDIGQAILEAIREMRDFDIPLNRQQAAVYLGVSSSTIPNYVKRGLLKKKVHKGLSGYLVSDLDKLRHK